MRVGVPILYLLHLDPHLEYNSISKSRITSVYSRSGPSNKQSIQIRQSTYHKILRAHWAFMRLAFLQPEPDNIMFILCNFKARKSHEMYINE